jgi:hypothetical protein
MRDICGPEVASKVGPIWGFDEDGQLMGAWRDCGHEGLWFGIGKLRALRDKIGIHSSVSRQFIYI